jgi:hypothetical protein
MTTSEPLPKLSVVVVCSEMTAQIRNTLQSILPRYERDIFIGDCEIILMDNGSANVLDEPMQKILSNLNYIYLMREALQP